MSTPKHVLVVERSESVRDTMGTMLESCGYRVSLVATGEAMRRLLAGNHGIDAVVLDASMSTYDADALARHVNDAGLPLVMVSGNLDEMEFAAATGRRLLRKPFKKADLAAALDQAFAGALPRQGHARGEPDRLVEDA